MSNSSKSPLRSPSYPSMPLQDAVNAIARIEKVYRTTPVDRAEAAKLIGYSALSGPAAKALAALASYGLLERAGKGETRVTDRAKMILYPGSEEERLENLRAAALEPPLFRDLRERFEAVINDGMLPESGVVRYLEKENFNPSAVRPAARAFLKTMEFLASHDLDSSHGGEPLDGEDVPGPSSEAGSVTYGGARVGDLVQWESQGVLQFKEPKRVRYVTKNGDWLAIEGSMTGIPMNEVIVERSDPASAPPVIPPEEEDETRSSQSAEIEWMRNRVGRVTHVRVMVTGEMGTKEIGRLIRLLETQREVLLDEEEGGDTLSVSTH